MSKAAYVRAEAAKPHDGSHLCHAVACERPCPPALLMCAAHWRLVPVELQREVWRTYRPGQERDKSPSRAYLLALKQAVNEVARLEGRRASSASAADGCASCQARTGVRLVVEVNGRCAALCGRCWSAWVRAEIEVFS